MTLPEKISKLDAARRQLIVAINLFFEGRDPLAIHTLTTAADGILADLCLKKGISQRILWDFKEYIKPEYHTFWIKQITEIKNFLKNADRDPEDILEFKEKVNQHFILLGIIFTTNMFRKVQSSKLVYLLAFRDKKASVAMKDDILGEI